MTLCLSRAAAAANLFREDAGAADKGDELEPPRATRAPASQAKVRPCFLLLHGAPELPEQKKWALEMSQ